MIPRTALAVILNVACAAAQPASELRFCLRTEPKTFDPLLATEEASETVRYLTGGVLIRFNRMTQQLEPELAESWRVRDDGRRIDFVLRKRVLFSDGTPFTAASVVATVRRMMDPGLQSAIADTFRSGAGDIRAEANGPDGLSMFFSAPVAGVELLIDQLAISSPNSAAPQRAVLGPFVVADYKAGQYVLLQRNPHYWQTDSSGNRLPYVHSIRLDIQANRDTELLRFRKGELHFVDKLEPEVFDRLRKEMPSAAVDAGASLDSEFLWFNQYSGAPFPAYKLKWFQSKRFRRALSAAIQRDDIVRLVYHGYARPAVGAVSESNKLWVNSRLRPQRYDPEESLRLLGQDGFRLDGESLRDRDGHVVEFSLITNAGSKVRAQIGAIVQQDLKRIGIRLNFIALEFQSLIERITRTQQYEACLLGFTNVDPDPSAEMNVWVSSSTHHAWNPGQKTPATPWEKEIDALMKEQATAMNPQIRKKAYDRVQEIIADEVPILYLVNPKVLVAVSPALRNAAPSPLPPHLYWNIERLSLAASPRRKER